MGKGHGLPGTVGAFVSDKVCAMVVKKEGVPEAVSVIAVEEDEVPEIVDGVFSEEENLLGRAGSVVVVWEENSETYDIFIEEERAESVVVERGLSWLMQ